MSERRYGVPRSDIERVMRHYGVSYEEAERGLREGRYPLPPRGTRLGLSSSSSIHKWQIGLVLVLGGTALMAYDAWWHSKYGA